MTMTSTAFMADLGGYTSVGITKLDKIDCSQVLSAILLGDRELLGHIKMGAPAHNIRVDWIEDELQPCTFEAYSSEVSTTLTFITSFTATTSAAAMIPDGAMIAPIDPANGTDFVMRVTSVLTSAGCKLAATWGSTTWTTVDTTTVWQVIAKPYDDSSDASSDISKARTKRKNFMQIFERAIEISQTRKGMDMEAVTNELQLQIKRRTMEIKRELDLSVISGIAWSDGTNYTADSSRRSMQGFVNFMRDPGYVLPTAARTDDMVTVNSGNALNIAAINALCYKVYGAGGLDEFSDPIIVVGPKQQRAIAAMEAGIRRADVGENKVGYYKDVFLSDMGVELPIVLDRWFPAGMLAIMDRNRMFLRALAGDAWHLEKMAKTGRHEKWQLSGQYTIEIRNANAAHGLLVDIG